MNKEIPATLIVALYNWVGRHNLIYLKHIKGLKGSLNCVLSLNMKRKGMPGHPVHLREGMAIRNFMRSRQECIEWDAHDFDDNWVTAIEKCFEIL